MYVPSSARRSSPRRSATSSLRRCKPARRVRCVYTAKALTFEIRRWAYPNPVQRERTLQVAKARYAANARAKAISDLGDDAWAINEYVDVIQGPYEYYFAAYPTEEPNYHVDRTDQLTTIAKAFLSPQ